MKIKFETVFRFYVVALVTILLWSVWRAAAQNETNVAAAAAASVATPGPTNSGVRDFTPKAGETPEWVDHLAANFPFLEQTLWGNQLWKYLFSLIYIFLAFYISKFLDFATRIWLRKLAERTKTKFDNLMLDLLNGPIKVVSFVIFLRIGLQVFHWPDIIQNILAKGFTVVVAMTLIYMALKFVDVVVGYWQLHTRADDQAFEKQLFPIISKSLKLFVIVVGMLVTLDNLNVNITAALASLSIGGLAVGLAAQDTLGNLFGAVAMFADKPFRIGDGIQAAGLAGTVETIGLRSTRIRSADGDLITIPNKTMGNANIVNTSLRSTIRTEMNIGLAYDTPAPKMKRALEILTEVYRGNPLTGDLVVNFNKFTDSALNILVVHVWKGMDGAAYQAGIQEMNLKVKERFDAEGIQFARPGQVVYVRPAV